MIGVHCADVFPINCAVERTDVTTNCAHISTGLAGKIAGERSFGGERCAGNRMRDHFQFVLATPVVCVGQERNVELSSVILRGETTKSGPFSEALGGSTLPR